MQELALGAMLLLTLLIRASASTWLHPAPIFAVTFTAMFWVSGLDRLPDSPLTSILILIAMAGALAACPTAAAPRVRSKVESGRWLRNFVIGGTLAGFFSVLVLFRANGVALSSGWHFAQLLQAASDVTVRRYTRSLSTPPVATIALAWLYAAATLSPFAAASRTGIRRVALMIAPCVAGGYYSLATTAKTAFLFTIAFTAASWVVTVAVQHGGRVRLRPRNVLGVLLSAAVIGFGMVYLTATRAGGWTPQTRRAVTDSMLVYIGGGLPAFEQWIHAPQRDTHLRYGEKSFAGISQFFASDPNVDAPYADLRSLNGLGPTNVYSILRPLTEDFGLIGAVVALVVLVFLTSLAFRHAILARSPRAAVLASVGISVILLSLSSSVLTFVSVVAAFVLAYWVAKRHVTFADPALTLPSDAEVKMPAHEQKSAQLARRKTRHQPLVKPS